MACCEISFFVRIRCDIAIFIFFRTVFVIYNSLQFKNISPNKRIDKTRYVVFAT